ncbi:hypothetical protein TWF694_005481 [Orbilia ellipsospora]
MDHSQGASMGNNIPASGPSRGRSVNRGGDAQTGGDDLRHHARPHRHHSAPELHGDHVRHQSRSRYRFHWNTHHLPRPRLSSNHRVPPEVSKAEIKEAILDFYESGLRSTRRSAKFIFIEKRTEGDWRCAPVCKCACACRTASNAHNGGNKPVALEYDCACGKDHITSNNRPKHNVGGSSRHWSKSLRFFLMRHGEPIIAKDPRKLPDPSNKKRWNDTILARMLREEYGNIKRHLSLKHIKFVKFLRLQQHGRTWRVVKTTDIVRNDEKVALNLFQYKLQYLAEKHNQIWMKNTRGTESTLWVERFEVMAEHGGYPLVQIVEGFSIW